MSKAFTREDVDPPERVHRVRSASGLPPGALNYITARGVRRLRAELDNLRSENSHAERIAELEAILESVVVVDPPDPPSESVAFGATVTVENGTGTQATYRIVGVDEVAFESGAVSWISPIGKTLLAAELSDRVTLGASNSGPVRIVKIEYPPESAC